MASQFNAPTKSAVGGGFKGWVKGHRLVSAIALVNLIGLFFCLIYPPILIVLAFQIPIGGVVAACLFIPRIYVMDRIFGYVHQRTAAMGAGGVGLLIAAVVSKAFFRGMRRTEGKFDPSMVASVVGVIFGVLVAIGIVVGLWKLFGLFRVIAVGYLVQFMFVLLVMVVGSYGKARRDREFDEFVAESRQMHEDFGFRSQAAMRARDSVNRPSFGPTGRDFLELASGETLIDITAEPGSPMLLVINEFLAKQNFPSHRQRTTGTKTQLVVRHSGSMDDLAKLINFGEVQSIDQDSQTINVSVTRQNALR
ncbi:hypothetical protein LOC67_01545 [Stieleria sp. JC731]|uniref:hypothetical protein n=1 Tax=Pirellulaceae TaxID=2691357 RepID=UPI001E2A0C57|nr:hypothetical protein [Stieleria sp. JC731]MCC9599226.1 hypothetical protein [Stieleria sp. JC731]